MLIFGDIFGTIIVYVFTIDTIEPVMPVTYPVNNFPNPNNFSL